MNNIGTVNNYMNPFSMGHVEARNHFNELEWKDRAIVLACVAVPCLSVIGILLTGIIFKACVDWIWNVSQLKKTNVDTPLSHDSLDLETKVDTLLSHDYLDLAIKIRQPPNIFAKHIYLDLATNITVLRVDTSVYLSLMPTFDNGGTSKKQYTINERIKQIDERIRIMRKIIIPFEDYIGHDFHNRHFTICQHSSEILSHIFSFLPKKDLYNAAQVCKEFSQQVLSIRNSEFHMAKNKIKILINFALALDAQVKHLTNNSVSIIYDPKKTKESQWHGFYPIDFRIWDLNTIYRTSDSFTDCRNELIFTLSDILFLSYNSATGENLLEKSEPHMSLFSKLVIPDTPSPYAVEFMDIFEEVKRIRSTQ